MSWAWSMDGWRSREGQGDRVTAVKGGSTTPFCIPFSSFSKLAYADVIQQTMFPSQTKLVLSQCSSSECGLGIFLTLASLHNLHVFKFLNLSKWNRVISLHGNNNIYLVLSLYSSSVGYMSKCKNNSLVMLEQYDQLSDHVGRQKCFQWSEWPYREAGGQKPVIIERV